MNAAKIFDKYAEALVDCGLGDDAPLSADAVFLALRLAIGDAWQESRPAVPDQRQAEVDRQQIAILAEWLEENEPALYNSPTGGGFGYLALLAIHRRDEQIAGLQGEIVKMDADNAGITEDLSAARSELVLLIAERDGLRRELSEAPRRWAAAQADADRMALHVAQLPITIHTNGAGPVAPTPAAQSTTPDWGRNHPAWRGLTDEEREQLYRVVSGAMSWRRLGKDLRRNLAQRVIWAISESGDVSQSQFDRQRPSWMPGANSLASTLGPKWTDLAIPMPY